MHDLNELKETKDDAFELYIFLRDTLQQATTKEAKAQAGREVHLAHIEYLKRETLLLQVLRHALQEATR